jgi:hypothetical protein
MKAKEFTGIIHPCSHPSRKRARFMSKELREIVRFTLALCAWLLPNRHLWLRPIDVNR